MYSILSHHTDSLQRLQEQPQWPGSDLSLMSLASAEQERAVWGFCQKPQEYCLASSEAQQEWFLEAWVTPVAGLQFVFQSAPYLCTADTPLS